MLIISHRRNTVEELEATPRSYGVEIDIRSIGSRLVLQHDVFSDGQDLGEWLERFRHRTLILNVKEEGLEEALLEAMSAAEIDDYFFLDQSFPHLVKYALRGHSKAAVRVSEYESLDNASSLSGLVDWVWFDSFHAGGVDVSSFPEIKAMGFKICLVSPELQGRAASLEVAGIRAELAARSMELDAVCTKLPQLWKD